MERDCFLRSADTREGEREKERERGGVVGSKRANERERERGCHMIKIANHVTESG